MKTFALVFPALLAATGLAQENDRLVVAFSDPAKPKSVRINIPNGTIRVSGHQGSDVVIESSGRSRSPRTTRDGLRRITNNSAVNVEERDNVISVSGTQSHVSLTVPFATSLHLRGVNSNHVAVDHLEGEIDVDITNGAVSLTEVSGPVIANALNGRITAILTHPAVAKPMSFTSLNGDIDVTLPADLRANVRLKALNGDVYTDFEVTTQSRSARADRGLTGTINGGGPELTFSTLNGKIFIRKKK